MRTVPTNTNRAKDPPAGSFAAALEAAMAYRHDVTIDKDQIIVTTGGTSQLAYTVLVHDVPGGAVVARGGRNVLAITMPAATPASLARLLASALEAQIDIDTHIDDVG